MRSALVLVALVACGGDDGVAVDAPFARHVQLDTAVAADGLSPDLVFTIPPATRSLTVVVEGDKTALYALGAFALGDGVDLVGLSEPPGPAMQSSYYTEQIGHMPGMLYQSIRLGTFTQIYPYKPGQNVIAGQGRLRVASTTPGAVKVTVLMPEDTSAMTLPLQLVTVSDTLAAPDTAGFTAEMQRIFTQVNITVTYESANRITGHALSRITEFTEPQEAPESQSAMLPALASGEALPVFFVDSLPQGVGGLSLGTPGPPLPGSYYFGVIVRGTTSEVERARVVAHEVAHFVALHHVMNTGISGTRYPDPIDDTVPGAGNLMEGGTLLTPGQAFALSRSALLR